PIGLDTIDRIGHEFNVLFNDGLEPPVVDEHSLAERWVGGDQLFDEIVTVPDLIEDIIRHIAAMPVIDLVDGAILVWPLRIDLERWIDRIVEGPCQSHAIPSGVPWNMLEQKLCGLV